MIDLYCERLDPGFWAEPINALTNLSFIIAAIFAWQLANRLNVRFFEIRLLILLMIAIGLGSALFHTFATGWAQILDIVPILLFQLVFLWVYGRSIIRMPNSILHGVIALFLILAIVARQFPHVLNGSLIYAPAFLVLLVLGFYHFHADKTEKFILLMATGVFALSLFFRTIDMTTCPEFHMGTHFLWHLFNGVLVYLVARSILKNLQRT